MDDYYFALNNMAKIIKQSEKKKHLLKIEQEIFLDALANEYIKKFQKAQDDFNFILSHFKNDEELKDKYRKILVEAKKEMDNYPLIKKYNDLYSEITEPTIYLENELKSILNGDNNLC